MEVNGPTPERDATSLSPELNAMISAPGRRQSVPWAVFLTTVEDWQNARKELGFSRQFSGRKPKQSEKQFYLAAWRFCDAVAQNNERPAAERKKLMTRIYGDEKQEFTSSTLEGWIAEWIRITGGETPASKRERDRFKKRFSDWALKHTSTIDHGARRLNTYREYMRLLCPNEWQVYGPVSLSGWRKAFQDHPEWHQKEVTTLRKEDENFRHFYRAYQEWVRARASKEHTYRPLMSMFLQYQRTPFLKNERQEPPTH